MSSLVITVKNDETQAVVNQILRLNSTKDREVALAVSRYFKDLAAGRQRAAFKLQSSPDDPVAPTQTITCDQSAATADDVVSILGIDLTAKASGASTDEFNIGDNDTDLATNLAAAINAQATLSKFMTAESAAAVVTITLHYSGSLGDYLQTSSSTVSSGTPFSFSDSGAFDDATGGIEDEGSTYECGIAFS